MNKLEELKRASEKIQMVDHSLSSLLLDDQGRILATDQVGMAWLGIQAADFPIPFDSLLEQQDRLFWNEIWSQRDLHTTLEFQFNFNDSATFHNLYHIKGYCLTVENSRIWTFIFKLLPFHSLEESDFEGNFYALPYSDIFKNFYLNIAQVKHMYVVALDANFNVLGYNNLAKHVYQIDAPVLGKNMRDLFPNFTKTERYQDLVNALKGEIVPFKKYKSTLVDRFLEDFILPIKNHNKETIGITLVGRDITEDIKKQLDIQSKNEELESQNKNLAFFNKELTVTKEGLENSKRDLEHLNKDLKNINKNLKASNRELASSNEDLMSSNQDLTISNNDLNHFASIASHDLQEPLRKITMFSSRIYQKDQANLSDDSKVYFEKIYSSIHRMNNLIQSILSFSKLGSKTIHRSSIEMNELIEEIKFDLEEVIEAKKAVINYVNLPTIKADRYQMTQLFQNIISNSLKYQKKDLAPVIAISAKIIDYKEKKYWKFTISDNGIGFSEQYSEQLFQMFVRLHPKHEFEGTGIGLALSKRIVDNHNGYIFADSKENVGSNFYILIPE